MRVAALVMGDREPAHFTNAKPAQYDAWDARALAEEIARVISPRGVELVSGNGDDDVLWRVLIDGAERGHVVRVALDAPVWASPAFGVEIILSELQNDRIAPPGEHAYEEGHAGGPRPTAPYYPLPTMPASEFDLALLIPEGTRAADVDRVIRASAGELLERLEVFDLYEGPGMDAGHRSVAWRLTLRHPERTLREKEIEGRRSRILSALETELNVRQRST
jgi:phenylalanyl-tRNA synthetase beta chain